MTRDRYAVLGNPVAHSRSPEIHAAFARQTGQAMDYGRILCPLDAFAATVRDFAAGGDGQARGCNVTLPFKFEAARLAARSSERARLAGAANTLRFDADGWYADNTDGVGLVRDIEINAARPLAGARVLLVGAGGAAAGVLGPLLAARPATVALANRTPGKAAALVDRHAAWAAACGVPLAAVALDRPGRGHELLINASSSSLGAGDEPTAPVPASALAEGALAVDLMYGPAAAAFLTWARRHGATARDGLGMLVEQAAESFQLWRGVRPETAPVLHALRAALEAAP